MTKIGKKLTVSKLLIYTLMFAYLLVSIYPLLWLLFYSLKDNSEIFVTNPFGPPMVWKWDNYARAVKEFNIGVYFRNSVIVAFFSVTIGILVALLFTYVVARVRNKYTRALRMTIMMGMFIPVQAIMTPLVVLVKNLHLTNSLWSLIVPYVALGLPFSVMVLYGFYVNLPIELEEAAYMEGASFTQTYFKIILPQVKPAISVLAIYQFMSAWNEFNLALVLLTQDSLKTLPLGLSAFKGQFSTDWGATGASLVIASLPVLILYLFFSEKVSDSMAFSGMKD